MATSLNSAIDTSVWILGDQLSADWPAWLAEQGHTPANTRVVMIESLAKLRSRPWHRHKLTLVLAAMRHFADELCGEGWQVDYREAPSFDSGLHAHRAEFPTRNLIVMRPSTYDGAQFVTALARREISVIVWPNRMFLATPDDLGTVRSPLLESFYRKMRKRTGLLMDGDEPAGGRWNHDADNRQPPRKPWRKGDTSDVPAVPRTPPDAITRAVQAKVGAIAGVWGASDGFSLPVTRTGAWAFFERFVEQRLAGFGPYEDAMVDGQPVLFHSLISPLLNIGLLDRDTVCAAVDAAYRDGRAPLNSAEGFIRQVIGWREFVYACYWREMPGLSKANALGASRDLPKYYWEPSDGAPLDKLACLSASVRGVWNSGYTHHIQRLMVLSNFALLADVSPQQLNEWFLCTYLDAYDWVVTPNVVGMGTYGDGGVVGTKPYAAGANYLNKMGTHCERCTFDPKKRIGERACPFNSLYWDFIARHAEQLGKNPRTSMPVMALRKMKPADVDALRQQARAFRNTL